MSEAPVSRKLHLLDLPQELLPGCLPHCYSAPPSWAACRRLLDLFLAGIGSGGLRLFLALRHAEDLAARRETLVRVEQLFPALRRLAVHVGQSLELELCTLLAPPPSQGPDWLSNIVDTTIQGSPQDEEFPMGLDSFIPLCIAQACPKLVRCTLLQVGIMWAEHQPSVLPHLQALVLDQCTINMQPEAVKQQLNALPSLKDFKLVTHNSHTARSFSSRVSELEWQGPGYDISRNQVLTAGHPCLAKLTAHGLDLTRADVIVMTDSMPNLKQLEVPGFRIPSTISLKGWQLESISTSGEDMSWDGLKSLHNMLANTDKPPRLCYRGEMAVIDMEFCDDSDRENLHSAADVTMTLVQAGGLQQDGGGPANAAFQIHYQHTQGMLLSLLHIFDNLQSLSLQGQVEVSEELLGSVGQLSSLRQLELADYYPTSVLDDARCCSFEEGIWDGRMISLLPQVDQLTLKCAAFREVDVTVLCCTAPRHIKACIHVSCEAWSNEGLERVVQAAAQCSLIELDVVRDLKVPTEFIEWL